jgi:uncharacterized protein
VTELLHSGPKQGVPLVLAHGAGAAMDHSWMEALAAALAEREVHLVRFEFPYMAARREGRRPPPDRPSVTAATWHEVIAELGGGDHVVIGGKSFGGRMASLVADAEHVRGLVCLGYPFHPSGKPQQLRTEHLATLRTPTLILQGERDAFGSREEVEGYALSDAIDVRWFADSDHSLQPRKASGRTLAGNLASASAAIAEFMRAQG